MQSILRAVALTSLIFSTSPSWSMNATALCNSIEPWCTYSALGTSAVVTFGLTGVSIVVIGKSATVATHFAIKHNSLSLLKIIGGLFTVNGGPLDHSGKTATHYAAEYGHPAMVEYLTDPDEHEKLDADALDKKDNTPLLLAIKTAPVDDTGDGKRENYLRVIRVLSKKKYFTPVDNKLGEAAILCAIKRNFPEALQLLLRKTTLSNMSMNTTYFDTAHKQGYIICENVLIEHMRAGHVRQFKKNGAINPPHNHTDDRYYYYKNLCACAKSSKTCDLKINFKQERKGSTCAPQKNSY